jgi:NADH-quinone oxidoreductase subunit J
VGLLVFGLLASVLAKQWGRVHLHPGSVQRTADVANSIFTQYVVPFEAVSVVLLAALVGAVVIARRD